MKEIEWMDRPGEAWWPAIVAAVGVVLLGSSALYAQWVAAAHAVKNRVHQMSQRSESGGYDVATVILEAPAARVYERTLAGLQAHPEIRITKNDRAAGQIEFSKGKQVAGFQIAALGDRLTQLVIASNVVEGAQPSATPL